MTLEILVAIFSAPFVALVFAVVLLPFLIREKDDR